MLALAATAAFLPACGSGSSPTAAPEAPALRLEQVRIDRPALPEQAVVRLVIDNGTATDDRLVSVSSPVAETTSIHRSSTDAEGRDVMSEVDGVDVPARSSVTFAPGGLHVMLTGITRDLEVGDTVPVTFTFDRAGRRTATAEVVEPGTGASDDEEHAHG